MHETCAKNFTWNPRVFCAELTCYLIPCVFCVDFMRIFQHKKTHGFHAYSLQNMRASCAEIWPLRLSSHYRSGVPFLRRISCKRKRTEPIEYNVFRSFPSFWQKKRTENERCMQRVKPTEPWAVVWTWPYTQVWELLVNSRFRPPNCSVDLALYTCLGAIGKLRVRIPKW